MKAGMQQLYKYYKYYEVTNVYLRASFLYLVEKASRKACSSTDMAGYTTTASGVPSTTHIPYNLQSICF